LWKKRTDRHEEHFSHGCSSEHASVFFVGGLFFFDM
jgi:hypothetical protein